MKKLIFTLNLLLSFNCFFFYNFNAFGTSLNTPNISAQVLADCDDCVNNRLINGGFEQGVTGWNILRNPTSASTSLNGTTESIYVACGNRAAMFNRGGSFYQDVQNINVGDEVKLTIYGARHDNYGQRFQLQFFNSNNSVITTATKTVNIDKNISSNPQGLKQYTLTAVVPAQAVKVRVLGSQNNNANAWIKVDAACLTITQPPIDCNCDKNQIANGSFESGVSNWVKTNTSTNFSTGSVGQKCGSDYGVITGVGSVYQDVALLANSAVNLKIWGGTSVASGNQKFKVSFFNASNTVLHSEEKVVNNTITNYLLSEYVFPQMTAPAQSVKVRIEAISASGTSGSNLFKMDGICLAITPPPIECGNCDVNQIANGSFESSSDNWIKKDNATNFTTETEAQACGNVYGVITGAGSIYQDVALSSASVVNLKIWGGVSAASGNQKFRVTFLKADNSALQSEEIIVNYTLVNNRLSEFTFPQMIAPSQSVKIRIEVISESGTSATTLFKVDGICLQIIPPPIDCNCEGNKIVNGSFEASGDNWIKSDNATNFTMETENEACGEIYGVITGVGSIYQDVVVTTNSIVNLKAWGGVSASTGNQKFRVSFLDINNNVLLSQEMVVTNILVNNKLSEYGFPQMTAPSQVVKMRIQAISESGTSAATLFKVDGICLKITYDTPMPVTLVNFGVKKENETSRLVWSTSSETNTKEFEIEHSQNGDKWNKIGTKLAQGDSKTLIEYSHLHSDPIQGNNYYRLKMIDLDLSFTYSRMVAISIDGISQDHNIFIYPNPTSDYLFIDRNTKGNVNIEIHDTRGVKVLDKIITSTDAIDLKSLVSGLYVVKLRRADGVIFNRKIQVIK